MRVCGWKLTLVKPYIDSLLLTAIIVNIVLESLKCIDYMNRKSLDYMPRASVYGVFILLILLNVLIFALRWILLVQNWAHHLEFFKQHNFLYTDVPSVVWQLQYTATILLHDGIHKFLMYFYFARYKPVNFPLTFITFLDLFVNVLTGGVRKKN